MRTPLVAGNWKMNKATVEAAILAQDISNRYVKDFKSVDVVLCPPFIGLKTVQTVLRFDKSPMKLGAQDVYWEDNGAYTGAISPRMLREEGVCYCIVGHSERREFFAETDLMVSRKAKALLVQGITPIICVGEGLALREEGATKAVAFVLTQLKDSLQLLHPGEIRQIVIAYEPIWAIGTGRTATPESAQEICLAIRAFLSAVAGPEVAEVVRILYGGSMKAENVKLFVPMPDIDGGLVGGAALNAQDFIDIVKAFA